MIIYYEELTERPYTEWDEEQRQIHIKSCAEVF